MLARLWQDYGLKLFRYCGVSVFNLAFGQSLLLLFYGLLHWRAGVANVSAVCISAGPAYILSRKWVWGQTGSHSVRSEMAPFWGLALLGLVISTFTVRWADHRFDSTVAVSAASTAAFGFVWVFKFFVLEKIMWKQAIEQVDVIEVEPAP